MHKHLILYIMLCLLPLAARGQTPLDELDLSGLPQPTQAAALRYWFDDDAASVMTTTQLQGTQTLDVSALAEGLHTLHYQVTDNTGAVAITHSALFVRVKPTTAPQAAGLRYWFDDDAASVKTTDGVSNAYTLDASTLVDGLHTLHCQVAGTDGDVYSTASALFIKMGDGKETGPVTARKLMYWYDDETDLKAIDMTDDIQLLDALSLADGLHTLHYQVLCNNGQMTSAMSSLFLRMSAAMDPGKAKSLRYWFDDGQTATEVAIAEGVQTIDVSALEDGLHTLHFQTVDNHGVVGIPASSIFLKMEGGTMASATGLRYWFDNETAVRETSVAGGTQAIDASGLTAGLHTLYYQLTDSEGRVDIPTARMFFKDFDRLTVDGGNRITQYQYWLNRNSEAMQTVELSNAPNPYTLLSLLPLEKEPIHSDCFQFEVTDGVPMVYAKNVFHVRFHDAQGYFSDGEQLFVDYNVKQEVTDAEWLESGVRATTAKPVSDAIKWYCLEAEPGDSLQFRLDRAATVQLFAPSGKEILAASGAEAVAWFGCHVWEEGTFYVALHDVTATYGNTVSIDYNHIDKYAVLRQDVSVVGNGGCSTITFEGNGFRDLYAVDLYNAQGDTIHHVYIGHESDATTSVVLDFNAADLGKYHALFHFTEEYKMVPNLMTVEEARNIELETKVTYPSTFLLGTSTTYTIKITNSGNMTAYAVPIEMHIFTDDVKEISEIKINGYSSKADIFTILQNDSIDEEAIEISENAYRASNGLCQFALYHDSITNKDYALSYAVLDLPPNTSKLLTVSIKSTSPVIFEAYTNKEWFPVSLTSVAAKGRGLKGSARESMCCMRSKVECVADVVVNLASGALPPGANCITSFSKEGLEVLYDVWCSEGEDMKERFDNYLKTEKLNLTNRLIDAAIRCVTGYYGKWLKSLREDKVMAANIGNVMEVERITNQIHYVKSALNGAVKAIYDGLTSMILGKNCYDAFTKPIPGCPPDPDGGGGTSTPVAPRDPNDITGYTAESTSKALKDGQTDVYYKIEFENDPEFATAAAHDIYLTDTLDNKQFDLSTFKPTRIRIGEKTAELAGDKNFVTTIDMRPGINAIAQVEGAYDEKKGIARWHISSLDPMTMEPTTYVMDGVLPVNTDGRGIGEVWYDIKLKSGLAHGTEIDNRAGIVFDNNEVIMTPTWTNIIDRIAPESHVADVQMLNDSTASVRVGATDELSGPWCYNVYVQYGDGTWFLGAENVPIDQLAKVKVYQGIDHGFYTVVTDSAGNVERKEAQREYTFEVFAPQVDTATKLQLAEGWNWISQNQNTPLAAEALKPKAQRIMSQTEELYNDARFGWTGDLDELLPTQMYKVLAAGEGDAQLSGPLFNAAFRSVPLYEGWNWIGYPAAKTMSPAEALAKLEAEEGDALIGQDGLATYTDGRWTGTLTELAPGLGYQYRSMSDKHLFLNTTAQASSRMAGRKNNIGSGSYPDSWLVNKRKYPNIMGIVATLYQNGEPVADADEWLLGAFSGDECRGLAQTVDGVLMMNVYGQGGEPVTFYVMHRESGEILSVSERMTFSADLIGSVSQPLALSMSVLTGITDTPADDAAGTARAYDLQGRRVDVSRSGKGVYIVTDKSRTKTRKTVRP